MDAIKERLIAESAQQSFGEIAIRDVRAQEQTGDDDSYIHLIVYADDPAAGSDTWPWQDVFALRRRVYELVSESDVDLPPIAVDVYPVQREDAGVA